MFAPSLLLRCPGRVCGPTAIVQIVHCLLVMEEFGRRRLEDTPVLRVRVSRRAVILLLLLLLQLILRLMFFLSGGWSGGSVYPCGGVVVDQEEWHGVFRESILQVVSASLKGGALAHVAGVVRVRAAGYAGGMVAVRADSQVVGAGASGTFGLVHARS